MAPSAVDLSLAQSAARPQRHRVATAKAAELLANSGSGSLAQAASGVRAESTTKPSSRVSVAESRVSTMSSRKRADRGRSGGNGDHANEQTIWDGCQDSIKKIMELVQRSEACKKEIFAMEAEFAELESNNKSEPTNRNNTYLSLTPS